MCTRKCFSKGNLLYASNAYEIIKEGPAHVIGKILYDPGIVTDVLLCTDGLFKQVGMRVALEF